MTNDEIDSDEEIVLEGVQAEGWGSGKPGFSRNELEREHGNGHELEHGNRHELKLWTKVELGR